MLAGKMAGKPCTDTVGTEGISMASGSSVEPQEWEQVHIPSDLLASLDEFFSTLKRTVIRQSCAQAVARRSEDEASIVTKDDVVASARAALTEAAPALDKALTPREPFHVRRAS